MKTLSLNGAWNLEIPGSSFPVISAQVPGSVYHDLLSNQLIDTPFWRDNEDEALMLMAYTFHYTRTFCVE